MASHSVNGLLRDICQKTGIRHVHPHMLRHTRLTEWALLGLSEYELKTAAGWTPNSNMAARYIHLTGRSHMRALLEVEGVPVEEVEAEKPTLLVEIETCPSCGGAVGGDMAYCPNCSYPIDERLGIKIALESSEEIKDLKDRVTFLTETVSKMAESISQVQPILQTVHDDPELRRKVRRKMKPQG